MSKQLFADLCISVTFTNTCFKVFQNFVFIVVYIDRWVKKEKVVSYLVYLYKYISHNIYNIFENEDEDVRPNDVISAVS